jgi:hypothetical protein
MKTTSRLNLPLWLIATILPAAMLMLSAQTSHASSATWNSGPATGDWNTATNWTPPTVPNGSADTATFALSNITGVSISANTQVNGIVFNAGASAFTITASPMLRLTVSGVGFTNNSGITQNFVTAVDGVGHNGLVQFTNSATAAALVVFTNNGSVSSGTNGGLTEFFNTSSAGNGTFINNPCTVSGGGGGGGTTGFAGTSTAGTGTFTNKGGTASGVDGGQTFFIDSSTAGNGNFINNATLASGANNGATLLRGSSSAGNGTFTNNGCALSNGGGGVSYFDGNSTAANGTFTNNGGMVSGASGGVTEFFDATSAGNGTFITNGGTVGGAFGGVSYFATTSSAGNGTFTTNGGTVSGALMGITEFHESSTAGNGMLIANGGLGGGEGGLIFFVNDSTGGTARIEIFGNGNLNISSHNAPGVTTGSIEGSGAVYLGANNLTVGSNNLGTTFSGIILDGGVGGSFTKTGGGTLSLTNTNTYSGGTVISAGTLQASQDGALGGGNVSLINPGVTLTLQSGPTNNYMADTANLIVVSGSTVNLNFSGNADTIGGLIVDGVGQPAGVYGSAASGAPHQLPVFAGTGRIRVVLLPFTFGSTGSLNTARQSHTATLLTNGKVLVLGGYNSGGSPLASAELYDPASGTWTATGSLNTGRVYHTATLLSNGKVLVAGGIDATGHVSLTAELYDPASGTWAATGSLNTAHYLDTATLLPNGKVLVAGGFYGNGPFASAIAELYDPASGAWAATGSLHTARAEYTATLLPNGKVLVAGGRYGDDAS